MIIEAAGFATYPLESVTGNASLPAMPEDVERFQSAISSYGAESSAAPDGMLASIDNFASAATHKWQAVLQAFETESLMERPADMLKVQMYLVETSVTFDLIGKVAGKATQNLDQLLHVQ